MSLKDTIRGFQGIINGEYDALPEQAFYMVGTIEEVIEKAAAGFPATALSPKLAANTVIGELSGLLNRDGVEINDSRIAPAALAKLLVRVADNTISGKIAKEVLEAMWDEGKDADAIIEARGWRQITDESAIEAAIDAVIAANPSQLAQYRSGKDKLFGFFVGQVMKATQGKANPARLNELLKKKLGG